MITSLLINLVQITLILAVVLLVSRLFSGRVTRPRADQAWIGLIVILSLSFIGLAAMARAHSAEPIPALQDKNTWVRKLTSANENSPWHVGYNFGMQLARLPGDEAFEILDEAWDKIPGSVRAQLLKGFLPAFQQSAELNDRLYDVLHLGMVSKQENVREFAQTYLSWMTLNEFKAGSKQYKQWKKSVDGMASEEVTSQECKKFVERIAEMKSSSVRRNLKLIEEASSNIENLPLMQEALAEAGISNLFQDWIANKVIDKGHPAVILLAGGKDVSSPPAKEFAGIPAVERQIGNNNKKTYFQIGPSTSAEQPADGWKLVLVLPGGDGSKDFHPFCRRIHQNGLPDGYVAVQIVAPKWSNADNRVVWPTAHTNPQNADFTTETFIREVVEDVKQNLKIDANNVFALGWSSSGPALYANAAAPNNPVRGSFVAMSIYRPKPSWKTENMDGHSFFIFHSPDDSMIPIKFHARKAEKALPGFGARVKVKEYRGGHGWTEDVFGNINRGMQWLETSALAARN